MNAPQSPVMHLHMLRSINGCLHSPLVLTHEFGWELAENVQKSQVEGRMSLTLRIGLFEGKLNTVPIDREQHKRDVTPHKRFFSPKRNWMESYLCNMAIASLVLSWSRPKVREAPSELFNATERWGWTVEAGSQIWQHLIEELNKAEGKDVNNRQTKPSLMEDTKHCHWPAVSSEWASLHIGFCQSVSSCSWFPWWCHHSHCNTEQETEKNVF